MIAYVGFVPGTYNEEADLIHKLCAFENISSYELPREHLARYYRGGKPVVVLGHQRIDYPEDRTVLVGFYALVEHLQKHGLVRV